MYVPPPFAAVDERDSAQVIEENPFAILFSGDAATHLPLICRDNRLFGHFAKANPQAHFADGDAALAVFSGPHAYVSPTWFETDQAVPTWNYVAVHVRGRFRRCPDATIEHLDELTRRFERSETGWSPSALPASTASQLRRHLVAFTVEIDSVEGKWKLSQNHPIERRERIISALEESPDALDRDVAAAMRRTLE